MIDGPGLCGSRQSAFKCVHGVLARQPCWVGPLFGVITRLAEIPQAQAGDGDAPFPRELPAHELSQVLRQNRRLGGRPGPPLLVDGPIVIAACKLRQAAGVDAARHTGLAGGMQEVVGAARLVVDQPVRGDFRIVRCTFSVLRIGSRKVNEHVHSCHQPVGLFVVAETQRTNGQCLLASTTSVRRTLCSLDSVSARSCASADAPAVIRIFIQAAPYRPSLRRLWHPPSPARRA